VLALVVGLVATTGAARGDGSTFSVVSGTPALPSASVPNGSDVSLASGWTSRPAQPVQLSYDQLLSLWQNAGQSYGVPWNVLAAINKIESNFGRNMGPSSAGAIGWMQFMPSTWERWGTDADANGYADPWNPVDAIYSAARYLAASGGATDIRSAVFSYNHADWYVNQVLQLAQLYGSSDTAPADAYQNAPAVQGSGAVVAADPLQPQLDAARAAVAQADVAYRTALDEAQALAARGSQLTDQADAVRLLSNRLEAQKQAVQFGAQVDAAQAKADRLKQKLENARAALTKLESGQGATSGAAAVSAGNWVFPVGGGPASVSVSHYHHDYPAADITAPEGSPLYALSDGTVLHAWSWDQRCGTGFTMQTSDGQTWTYCHMSYMEPSVTQGAELTAGEQVGLVGQTGDATGPHLHLQLQPAATYPQDQDWFKGFAGTAFRWSDPGPAQAGAGQPLVFHIIRSLD
jgi:murein DD-endopeptidase MepM/ murein hydrolase activator NlpD